MNYFLLDVVGDVVLYAVILLVVVVVALGLVYGIYRLIDWWSERRQPGIIDGSVSAADLPSSGGRSAGGSPDGQRRSGSRGWASGSDATAYASGSSRGQGRGGQQAQASTEMYEPLPAGDESRARRAHAPSPPKFVSQTDLLREILVELQQIRSLLHAERERGGGAQDMARPTISRGTQARSSTSPETFRQLYNEAVDHDDCRSVFRERYDYVQLGTSNFIERRQNINLDPEFMEANDGEYYAVQLDDGRRNYYAVVPKFDLTFQESSHGPGAMGRVFHCPNYNPRLKYRRVKVKRPARFDRRGSQWILVEPGELDLGAGEQ